jgi:uncharacterized membrane protein YbhN (UPF0104 family)
MGVQRGLKKPVKMRKGRFFWVLPLGITVAILFFFFRQTSWQEFGRSLKRLPLYLLLVYLAIYLASTVIRTCKYRILLAKKVGFADMFLITLVRNFTVDLLPARAAALFFFSFFSKKRGILVGESASCFIVSMFYDALSLALMLAGLSFLIQSEWNNLALAAGMAVVGLGSLAVIFWTAPVIQLLLKIRLLHRLPVLPKFLQTVLNYLQDHTSGWERLQVFLLSLALRILKYGSLFLLFCGLAGLSPAGSVFARFTFGLAGTELMQFLPLQGLAGFGTWELVFSWIFRQLGLALANPLAIALALHLLTQVVEYSIGLLAFWRLSARLRPERGK